MSIKDIVGQRRVVEALVNLADSNKLPGFIILEGLEGSGRAFITRQLGEYMKAPVMLVDSLKVDGIRELIYDSQFITSKRIYIIRNADNMTVQAENALLKLAEEPPEDCHIVLTVGSAQNVLPTILSRARLFRMEPYSMVELERFSDNDLLLALYTTPGKLESAVLSEVMEAFEFSQKVVDNIDDISVINSFNISKYLKIKGDKGIDIELFITMLYNHFLARAKRATTKEEKLLLLKRLKLTTTYSKKFRRKSTFKLANLDMLILELKEAGNIEA